MFRPPVNRAMKALDRSFFQKKVPISAARILDMKNISKCRLELQKSKDSLSLDRYGIIQPDPLSDIKTGKKCLLLRPEIAPNGIATVTLSVGPSSHIDRRQMASEFYSLRARESGIDQRCSLRSPPGL